MRWSLWISCVSSHKSFPALFHSQHLLLQPGIEVFEIGAVKREQEFCFANGSCADIWKASFNGQKVAVKVWRGVPYTEHLRQAFHKVTLSKLVDFCIMLTERLSSIYPQNLVCGLIWSMTISFLSLDLSMIMDIYLAWCYLSTKMDRYWNTL